MRITIADCVISELARLGLRHLFFLPGGGCMYLVDALARSNELEGVAMLHEQSVGIAAEAYSQFTNKFSACLVTTGPGATNAITPCAAAWTDSTPVIFISGQVKTADDATQFGVRQLGFQEVPITEIVRPITKLSVKFDRSMDIHKTISELVFAATSGRPGPVWLDIPLDLQNSPIGKDLVAEFQNPMFVPEIPPVPEEQILSMLSGWRSSKRPLLLIGNGVRLAHQEDSVRELLRLTNTPALLTWKMIDFLDDADSLNAGRPGAIGQRWANIVQQNADFLLCLGARLDLGQVAYRLENFAPKAKKYICEVDDNEIAKLPRNLISFSLPLESFVPRLLTGVSEIFGEETLNENWINKISALKSRFPLKPSHQVARDSGVNLYDLISELSNILTNSDVLVPGSSGACSEVVMQAFKVKMGQRILNSEGLGPMGFGLPAAIGVATVANTGTRIVSIDGDGGFLMNIQDLVTVKYRKLPIIIFLLNNNGYGSIKSTQNAYFEGRLMGTDPNSGLGLPEWKSLIEGYGIRYLSIHNYLEMSEVLKMFDSIQMPCVIEVLVDPYQRTEPRVATSRLSSGELLTDDMADMTPKLTHQQITEIEDFLLSESNQKMN